MHMAILADNGKLYFWLTIFIVITDITKVISKTNNGFMFVDFDAVKLVS